ncbi:endonuclease VIII [Oceanicoccus sagamiensis]|uniref:DNA-(apurinic or apyrimidinic site) lyase n=1 Tax=Oceanicoccus sagamiensis TaxID=716816 RepID=A0A1X9N920_9GAMM|nr:endonuclease VIII [Oceanicoccus sagamiensis]ARN72932.1 endonuclease VIII [Oceanicoccus sagamiensis]
MPEGPEIRRAADSIEQVLKGQAMAKVQLMQPKLSKHNKTLQGHTVLSVETRGKALLTHFDHGWSLYSHNQLYGRWYIMPRGELPETQRKLRVALHTDDHSALLYSASDISVWQTENLWAHHFLSKIGPDILSPALTAKAIDKRLQERQFSGKSLSSLYLDQAFLAGIGNYLRSEILFAAGINPLLKARELNAAQRARLGRQTLAISQRSYKMEGVTQPVKRYRQLLKGGLSFEQARFAVFGREAKLCHLCGQPVKRIEANARNLFYCGGCQT